ncbi:MAG: lytic transglycosylase domain-containing protein [Thermoanaerobaculia bacterium]|nr:lytic transglycosylase domain-containing protein [Thermoanaerobaculia bacterium]
MKRPGPLLRATLVALLLSGAARAELVVLVDGAVLKVVSAAVDGGKVRLALPSEGSLVLPLARVERIVDDELVPLGARRTPEPGRQAVRLEFRDGDAVPEVPYGELIWEAASRHGVNPALVAEMVRAESAFDPRAVSSKGAVGLLQLMPATAERFGVPEHRLTNPEDNLEAGVRYVRWLSRRYPGDPPRVLAAYNAGEANVDRYAGVPPFRETRGYLARIYAGLGVPEPGAPASPR